MKNDIKIINHSDHVESFLAPYKDIIGKDFKSYRGHVYQAITYAMHFLDDNPSHRLMVETVFAFHDIGLWTDKNLAYLEPSEELALKANQDLKLGLDPEILRAAIHWHHKVTAYRGAGEKVVNAVRKADWVAASQGKLRKGLDKAQVEQVLKAVPDHGFSNVLRGLVKGLGGSAGKGIARLLKTVFKW